MAAETQYTANTGMVTMTVANANLDGTTGTYYDVLTAASGGTLIKTVTIKAQVNLTADGMIRLFAYNGTTTKLIAEINTPTQLKGPTDPAFETTIALDYFLVAGGKLKATTQTGQTVNVIAEGLNWSYYTTSIRPDSTRYTANTGMATINAANNALDGSGTLNTTIWDVITAASNGTAIQSVVIKAQVSTQVGMVRLFLYDGTNTKLLTEVQVPAVTKAGTVVSFSKRIDFNGKDFSLKAGWKLRATTEFADTFNVIAEGLDWTYPA